MGYPNFAGKHALAPFFTPQEYREYLAANYGWTGLPPLAGVILTFQATFFREVVSAPGWRRLEAPRSAVGDFHVLERENGAIGISGALGVGAPSATNRLEDIGAAGCSRFIAIGYAGALQPDLKVGDMVLCDRAIRDEGVSHHYLEPGKYAQPDRALTAALGNQMDVAGMGTEPGPPGPSTRPTARPSKRSADIETRACSRSGWRQPPSLPYRHTAGSTSQPLSW
jgi:hypothetical protein